MLRYRKTGIIIDPKDTALADAIVSRYTPELYVNVNGQIDLGLPTYAELHGFREGWKAAKEAARIAQAQTRNVIP